MDGKGLFYFLSAHIRSLLILKSFKYCTCLPDIWNRLLQTAHPGQTVPLIENQEGKYRQLPVLYTKINPLLT